MKNVDKTKKSQNAAGGAAAQDEEKASLKYFFKSAKYLKPYKWSFLLVVCASLIGSGISAVNPYFTENILKGFNMQDSRLLLTSALLLTAFSIVKYVINWIIWGNIRFTFTQKVSLSIQKQTLYSITSLKNKNFDKYGSGKYINVVTGDAARIGNAFLTVADYTSYALGKLAVFVYIFAANVWLGLYCLASCLVTCGLFIWRLKVREKRMREVNKSRDDSTALLAEVIRGQRDVKNYNIQETVVEKTHSSLYKSIKSRTRLGRTEFSFGTIDNISSSIMTLGYIAFAVLLIHYGITDFATAFTVYVFRNSLYAVFTNIVRSIDVMQDCAVSAKRVSDIEKGSYEGFEEFPSKSKFDHLPQQCGVEIKNLDFSYDTGKDVLKNFNITIKQGQKIALVGESGSGKSTILKLINKSYDVPEGKIFIGGQDICDFSKQDLRDLITIVPQDPYIFNLSVRENLTLIKPDATQDELDEACKKAQIFDYIQTLPEKYETKLGEGGIILSGGQKQRLAIARCFLKQSSILIFDEATSALDNDNQAKIKQVIDGIGKDKTVIIVAHRLSTIIDADVIYFMENGSIVQSGTHKQLLKNCKQYKELYTQEG